MREKYLQNPLAFIQRMNECIEHATHDTRDDLEERIAGGAMLFAFEYYGRKRMDEEELIRCAEIFGNAYIDIHKLCNFPLSAGED